MSTAYKICIDDRNYKSWQVYIDGSHETTSLPQLDPVKEKLFSCDVFTITEDGKTSLIHSTLKSTKNIPGILVVSGQTFGRRRDKMLYKLIPDDRRLPVFLAVAKPPQGRDFHKYKVDKYVVFEFKEWTGKHPEAVITNSLGTVDILDNFYEYQLYCKSLNASIQKFTRDTAKALRSKTEDEYIDTIMETYVGIENRIDEYIISIDPKVSGDFDDAFSLNIVSDTKYIIKIYISNVSLWMDALDIWESFSERISTIYLPDRKRPMLPTCLADCLCSLIENTRRFAVCCEVTVDNNQIIDVNYANTLIMVKHNYVYENDDMLADKTYQDMFTRIKLLSRKHRFFTNIQDSHDIIHYLMVLMNYYSAKKMLEFNNGIYRSASINQLPELPESLPDEFVKFMTMWNSSGGQYVLYNEDTSHDILDLDNYIHITSPIRRLPDLLNIIKLQQNLKLVNLTSKASDFYKNWVDRLDYINTTMRAIRKVQVDCNLLKYVMTNYSVVDKIWDGYVFDTIKRNDGLYQYICYIPELKLISRLTLREELENYASIKVKLYVFVDENRLKRKIRLQKI